MRRLVLFLLVPFLASCGGSRSTFGEIVFIRGGDVWTMRADGSGQRIVPVGRHGVSVAAALAPDRRSVAMTLIQAGQERPPFAYEGVVRGVDGSMTPLPRPFLPSAWLNAHELAVRDVDDYIVAAFDLRTRTMRRLGAGAAVAVQPGGTRIMVTTLHGLQLADGRGRHRVRLAAGYAAVWSPDGRWVAYKISGDPDVHLVRPDGSGRRALTHMPRRPRRVGLVLTGIPAWRPHASQVLLPVLDIRYGSTGESWTNGGRAGPRLDLVAVPSGRVVATFPGLGGAGDPDFEAALWAPDGRHFLAETAKGLVFVDAATGDRRRVG